METSIIIPQQRKLVVTGCFNCPYCKDEKELDYIKGRYCTHPSHRYVADPFIPRYVHFTNVDIGEKNLDYFPLWCPLPTDR